jgi:hypothetical protein
MATREQLRTMQTQQPFEPFLVRLADGRSFEVTHPELAACSKDGRSMTLYDDDGMHLLEMLTIVELVPATRPTSARRKAGGK